MDKIEKEIYKIGSEMIRKAGVYRGYEDVRCDPKKGILPRCLYYETEDRKLSKRGCVIVGINPGRAKEDERDYFRKNGATYKAEVNYWQDYWQEAKNKRTGKKHPYYERLRTLASDLGIEGPILWTELVKCESEKGTSLSVQTIRDDIHRYLLKEIHHIPGSWPLIGAGRRAYEILSFSFPKRTVIGVPHPTGSYGQFNRLMANGHATPDVRKKASPIIRNADAKPKCRLFFFKGKQLQFQ
jgi:hypothetical protein